MDIKLSQTEIRSFVGNVLPIRLLGVKEYTLEDILWSSTDPCVQINGFEKDEKLPFTDGVLLTLVSPGEATVTAVYNGNEYTCRIVSHEIEHTPSQKGLSYFIGDFHDHTQQTHDEALFSLRQEGIPYDYLKQVKDEGVLDFSVVSDHATLLSGREYFRGFWDAFCLGEDGFIPLPGCEAEISPITKDRYGIPHKVAGEIVTVNAVNYACVPTWSDFHSRYETSPFAISVLAHPQIIGHSVPGIWNFELHKNNTPRFKEMLKGVEMGDGTDRSSNHAHEYVYSVALDNGFYVSTTCSSDSHGPVWGATRFPGRTVIMAKERSKETFIDALQSRRFYATESGNVKLYYEVNGCAAPATLPEASTYRFHVELDLLKEALGGEPVNLRVISDYGKTVFQTDDIQKEMDFVIESNTARYFYLRFCDSEGRKTWSCPVLTGRAVDETKERKWIPIAKTGFTAMDEGSGNDASVLLNDNPTAAFYSGKPTCSILIDMQKEQTISALGQYPTIMNNQAFREAGVQRKQKISELAVEYEIETGLKKEDMTLRAKGAFRVFGAEQLVELGEHKARFVRLRILSTTGKESGRPEYRNHQVTMAEITMYR